MGSHLDDLRRSVTEQRFRTQTLWISVAAGLAAHVGGYLLRSSGAGEPLAIIADLLYSLGFALWTGAVVVALVEIFPQRKERQVLDAIARYEAAVRRGRTD
jgi:hypothetical protein